MQICLGALLVLLGLAGLAYVFRNPLATALAGFALDRQENLTCSHPDVEVSASLRTLVVSAIDCDVAKKPLAHVKTSGPMQIELSGFGPESIAIDRATFDYRERDVSHVRTNTAADLAQIVGMTDSLIKAVLDASEMYSTDSPRITVERLTMLRGGKRENVMHDFWMAVEGEWNRSHAARVDIPAEGLASVRNFDMRVTPVRGNLAMAVYLGEAERGEPPDAALRLEGKGLNQPHPSFDLTLKTGDDAARAHAR